jgi:hypothetical protein
MTNERPLLKSYRVRWAYSNCGILRGTSRTRRDAIKACEKLTGEPWKICRQYMEVTKVKVIPFSEAE